ncbi:U4/U6.U5 small nuclear ribonucleoprotein 27 kDa protein [Toxorhynchites rutilus septentrionalis]|uniref:U4/U6.U5 small nuclear ribonucleoprotein 27 kDa protein n=1 Tax=Toxorhynchites rutilus septentrionalis TaxID=329112 RepID=UPI002478A5C8|nr:U4/U6.U5 small nuclear ribonucleoprotein 27 kDa protein [Toxorhynchites rutilus septentrionalis]XP_055641099.1 U4/U6.U5 small nuclear ribonucleoprotein 27 kDa protein [Toxorhynchites rutilus septentrionalis]
MPSSPRRKTHREKRRERDRNRSAGRERRRSVEREKSRDRSRERRERDRERDLRQREYRRRTRSRSRSYDRAREKSPLPTSSKRLHSKPVVTEAELEGKSPEEQEMLKTMGFCGFDTTKGKKVEGNNVGEVHVILKRKYRQYMNRKGGFNRPLDFVA